VPLVELHARCAAGPLLQARPAATRKCVARRTAPNMFWVGAIGRRGKIPNRAAYHSRELRSSPHLYLPPPRLLNPTANGSHLLGRGGGFGRRTVPRCRVRCSTCAAAAAASLARDRPRSAALTTVPCAPFADREHLKAVQQPFTYPPIEVRTPAAPPPRCEARSAVRPSMLLRLWYSVCWCSWLGCGVCSASRPTLCPSGQRQASRRCALRAPQPQLPRRGPSNLGSPTCACCPGRTVDSLDGGPDFLHFNTRELR